MDVLTEIHFSFFKFCEVSVADISSIACVKVTHVKSKFFII